MMDDPKSIHILVVEDSLTQAVQLQFFLENNGYRVSLANNGEKGIASAKKDKPTIIISDIVMPEMDGYQMCSKIKADEELRDIPVILLTSLSNPEDVIQALACSADNFVTKPYDEKFLLSRIKHILINKDMRRHGKPEMGIEIFFSGKSHFITSDRMQIVDLLFSTYENAVERNKELMRMQLELKKANEKLHELATYDPLTGLANRRVFQEFLNMEMERTTRHDLKLAVLFMDLDNFKDINDTKGHDVGDLLLKSITERLRQCVRKEDLVSRLGGDEFAIVLVEIMTPSDAARVAEKILEKLALPHQVGGFSTITTFSIGIALFPDGGNTSEDLAKAADIAMYHAKQAGKNSYQFFEPIMQEAAMERIHLEKDLRTSFEKNQFILHYQPKVEAATGAIVGVEALMRWHHPQKGMVSPALFIPVAEKCGLIGLMGEWALHKACSMNAHWQKKFDPSFQLSMAVNVSIMQLKYDAFFATIEKIFEATGLDPRSLEIELTESTVMEDPETTIKILEQIHSLGIRIAVDDFGTGYSSLSYLRRLPIDVLKIDLSFVRNIGRNVHDEKIIKAIISLAHSLDLLVTAEGVETKEQLDFLKTYQCDYMQGYYFSPAVTADEIEKMMTGKIKK